ncbi:MAG: TonB-dependent receptor, partial [Blastocatellia bacterium]|nr:TonB-dependent receptor [Blastocatellia bacterium]
DQVSFYGQDSFRINRRLTLNYGVRYDADIGFYNPKNGSQATNRAVLALQKIGQLPQGDRALPQDDRNNFSPRIGIAFDPTGTGKAVLRASYGLFYDQIFQNVQFFGLQQAGNSIYALQVFDPIRIGIDPTPVRTGFLPDLPAGVGSGRFIDPNIRTPYTQQASINFQYEFKPGYIFDTNYIHILGLHQFVNVELNPRAGVLDPNYVVGQTTPRILNAAFAAAGIGPFSRFRMASSINRSRYDGFTVGINKRYSGSSNFKYQFGFNYTLARALVYGSAQGAQVNDFGFTFENPFNFFRPVDFGRSNEDARHRAVFNGLVDIPYGFQISTIIQAESARPFPVAADQDLNGDGLTFTDFPRLDAQGNFIKFNRGDKVTGTPTGINPGRGVPYFQVDLRVTKKFKLGEKATLQGYVEFFNLFNRSNVGNSFANSIFSTIPTGPNSSREAVNVKDIPSTGLLGSSFGAGTTIGIPFQAQFGVRLSF